MRNPGGIFALLLFAGTFHLSSARSRRNDPSCNKEQQDKMQAEFSTCLNKFTQEHHDATAKAAGKSDFQKLTCKLLSDTVKCGELWKRCHPAVEVRRLKDQHIAARIAQFNGNTEGIDVEQCDVVKEYLESGRADEIEHSTEGGCTQLEVSEVQTQFQACSHNKSTHAWAKIQDMTETNDIAEEIRREDREAKTGQKSGPDPEAVLQPLLCSTLVSIAKDCTLTYSKCFSAEDTEEMKRQHIEQMQGYFQSLYPGVVLDDCPVVKFPEDYPEDSGEYGASSDDDHYYENDDYDYDNYDEDDDESGYNMASSTTASSRSSGGSGAKSGEFSGKPVIGAEKPYSVIGASGASPNTVTFSLLTATTLLILTRFAQ